MKIAIIAVVSSRGETGGAERFYKGLTNAFNAAGAEADLIEIIGDESNFAAIEETYLRFYDLNVAHYDGVISTKAPSYLVRHTNHLCYLVHTMRVFYDMFEREFHEPTRELLEQRAFIRTLDTAALSPKRVKKIFSIGHEVAKRLREYNSLDSDVLHPALLFDDFKADAYGDYLFMPGRLHRWKRVDLVIQAMRYVKSPIKLKIAGTGEDEETLRNMARHDARIEFLGRVDDVKLMELYANSLAVSFTPQREDYGYVTLEAFKSKKSVITCVDSGEPTYFIKDSFNGFVCAPDPIEIADKIDFLFHNRSKAEEMGSNGHRSISHITWDNIVNKLMKALG